MLPWNPPSSFSSGNDPNAQQQQYRPNYPQEQQQQQPQQQQQQGQPQQQPGQPNQQQQQPAAGPPAYPPMTLASTLHFLQSEHRRYARDRNEWEIERAEMRARIALLEGEKRGNEGALRDLGRRCKMLENALRGERSKFLSTTNALAAGHTPSASGTSSPVHIPPTAASGIPPAKAAQLLSNLNPAKDTPKDSGTASPAPESTAMAPSTSSPGVAAPAPAVTIQGPGHQSRASSSLGLNGGTLNGTWGSGAGTLGSAAGTLGAARDPRGKARSRDYLKQCLQEITYLTSATTLNPLSATSYSAPNVPRPRKVLPDHIPAPGAPGVFNVSFPPRSDAPSSTSAGAPPAPAPAPPLPISSAAFELPPQQTAAPAPIAQPQFTPAAPTPQQPAHPITKFPSDPASAYVPLKRTISQPGVPGGPGTVRGSSSAMDAFTPQLAEKAAAIDAQLEEMEKKKIKEEEPVVEDKKPKDEPSVKDDEGQKKDESDAAASEVRQLSSATSSSAPTTAPSSDLGPNPSSSSSPSSPLAPSASPDGNLSTDSQPSTTASDPSGIAASNGFAIGDDRGGAFELDDDEHKGDGAFSDEGFPALSRVGRRGAGEGQAGLDGGGAERRGDDQYTSTIRRHGGRGGGGGRELDNGDVDVALGGVELGAKSTRRGEGGAVGDYGDSEEDDAGSRLTAIFKPESDEQWQEQLRKAGERAYGEVRGGGTVSRARGNAVNLGLGQEGDEDELASLEWSDEDVGEGGEEKKGEPAWGAKKTLRSHLDAVRALAFVYEANDNNVHSLVSGGDDMTVKLWRNLDLSPSARTSVDTEPIITYRGHTAPVTSLAVSTRTGLVYSGSLDSDIRVWRLPEPSFDTYDSFDPTTRVGSMSASGDAVWGLQLFENGDGEERLAVISADGYVRVWDTEKRECVKSWDYEGVEAKEGSFKRKRIVPTAITLVKSSPKGKSQLAVAYFDSVVKVFNAETGEEKLKLKSDESYDGTPQTQINQITSHPSKPLLATAHEDKYIRLFDLETGDCIHSTLAHLDGVTSLSFLTSGDSLVSVGHDTSLRFWNLDLVCTQEIASHRPKATEGILDVAAHDKEVLVASAGADGTVRLWARE